MSKPHSLGAHVLHAHHGLGKVIHTDPSIVHVYFRDRQETMPERKIGRFKQDMWSRLEPVAAQPDPVLDNLPPWNGIAFERFKTDLTIDAAKCAFLRGFPGGIDDPSFLAEECDYKRAATRRFAEAFAPHARSWIDAGDAAAIAKGLEAVYGRHLSSGERLNLLFARAEEPAYFDALRAGGAATVALAEALLAFLDSNAREDLERYIDALSRLPQRSGGAAVATWPTLTWLPFIAAPDHCMFVKPTIVQAFASASAWEIGYRPTPNAKTYLAILAFADTFRRTLQCSEVNLSGRDLDLIDTQSFMWVVERYTSEDVDAVVRRGAVRQAT